MKIAVTGTRGIPNILGGVETHCDELYPRIVTSGYDVTVICRPYYTHYQLQEYKGVKIANINAPNYKAVEAFIHTLKAIHYAKFKLKADTIHIHAVGPALLIPYAKLLGLKVVSTHHGPDYDREKWGKFSKFMLRIGERLSVKYADELIVISNLINDSIKTKYGRTNAHVIPNGVPKPNILAGEEYLQSLGIASRKYIFAMGRFVPEKNFDQLIRAFASLPDKKGYQLVLAGDDNFNGPYSTHLKQLATENNVVLTGFIKDPQLPILLSNAAAFVLPSSHEGLPISLLEAMNYGIPAIVSDIPANAEVGLPAENYFKVNDEQALADQLQQHINTGYQPVAYDMQKYDWDSIAALTAKVYERLK
jgi:glycosyltransferase involved in cell wall biosynthesis